MEEKPKFDLVQAICVGIGIFTGIIIVKVALGVTGILGGALGGGLGAAIGLGIYALIGKIKK